MWYIKTSRIFSWVSLPLVALPAGIWMLGVGKAVPAQFFADMQLRIYSANAPPAKRSIGYFSSKIANNLRGFELLPLATKPSDFLRNQTVFLHFLPQKILREIMRFCKICSWPKPWPRQVINCTQENGHDGFDPRPRLVDTHLTHRVRGTSSVIK